MEPTSPFLCQEKADVCEMTMLKIKRLAFNSMLTALADPALWRDMTSCLRKLGLSVYGDSLVFLCL